MSDECLELKNIKYQTMLLSNNYNKKEELTSNIQNIDECTRPNFSIVKYDEATNPNYKACAVFYGGRIKKFMGENNPPVIDLASDINCPVIGFFGNDDENPSPEDVEDYSKALTEGGVEHNFYRYDNAGHAFQSFKSEDKFRSEASEDAWKKVLDFDTHMILY